MDLLLTVEYHGTASASADVLVELDPEAGVDALRAALVEYGRRRGLDLPDDLAVVVPGDRGRLLADDIGVVDAGLVSGEVIRLVDREAVHRNIDGDGSVVGAVALDLTSGPEAGRTVVLRAGRYSVGRDEAADVTIGDPTMSREHFTLDVSEALEVTVHPNPQALNGTFVATSSITESRPLEREEVVFAGSTQLVLRAPPPSAAPVRDRLGQVAFNRLPYKQPIVRERATTPVAAPPPRAGRRRFPLLSMIIPIVGAAAIVAVTGRIEFALIAGLSPLMLFSNWLSEGRNSARSYAAESVAFGERVDGAIVELAELQQAERAERLAASPDVPLLQRVVRSRSGRLWERTRTSTDVLRLRLGVGPQPSSVTATIEPGGDPDLRHPAEARLAEHAELPLVPVTLDLAAEPVAALTGDPGQVTGVARLAGGPGHRAPQPGGPGRGRRPGRRRRPPGMGVAQVAAPRPVDDVARGGRPPRGGRPRRRAARAPRRGGPRRVEQASQSSATDLSPRVLALIDEAAVPDRARLSPLLDAAPAAGVHVLWLSRDPAEVPRQCTAVVHLERAARWILVGHLHRARSVRRVLRRGTRTSVAGRHDGARPGPGARRQRRHGHHRDPAVGAAPRRPRHGRAHRRGDPVALGRPAPLRARGHPRAGAGGTLRRRPRARTVPTRSSPARAGRARASCCRRWCCALAATYPPERLNVPVRRLQGRARPAPSSPTCRTTWARSPTSTGG